MPTTKTVTGRDASMTVMDAIYERRAIRSYQSTEVSKDVVKTLLAAAVQAPTAMHEEPWAFLIIQDHNVLKEISDSAKALLNPEIKERLSNFFKDPDFNIFYDAKSLIVIYGKPIGPFVSADAWLAAENLMLAACALELGTCVIGLAVQALDSKEWKQKLGVPEEMTAHVPIIVGVPKAKAAVVTRKEPEIIAWSKNNSA